ncbi:MAG: hypothetical protein RIR05_1765 [Bacteroidota bacterium]
MRIQYGLLILIALFVLYWLQVNPIQPLPKPLCLNQGYSFLNSQLQIKIKQQPKNPLHYLQRAQLFLTQGDTATALKDLHYAIKIQPHAAEPFFICAQIYAARNHSLDALNAINRAISLDTINAEYIHYRGTLKRVANDYIGAMSDYQKAIRLGKVNFYKGSGC